jgi:hypothetical protein
MIEIIEYALVAVGIATIIALLVRIFVPSSDQP